MRLYFPFKNNFTITQPFSKNFNTYYSEGGLLGHQGIDMASFHGDTIYASCDGLVYSHINKDNPDLMRYRAVYQLVEDDEAGVAYEVSYGHLMDIFLEPEVFIKKGTPIGTQGNTGDVASGGVKVTKEMKASGSGAGSHLHFQVRLLKKVSKKEKGKKYLTVLNGTYKKDGFMYEVVNYKNGFNGAIDPAQFWIGEKAVSIIQVIKEAISPTLTVNLRYGARGSQVKLLQKKLGIKQDGIFGKGTEFAVIAFQKKNKLVADGIVGIKTRALLG